MFLRHRHLLRQCYKSHSILKHVQIRSFANKNDDEIDFFSISKSENGIQQHRNNKNLSQNEEQLGFDPNNLDDNEMYSSDNHSLVPYLYMYKFFEDNIGYVIMEPKTKQLIAVDIGCFETSYKIISQLEKKYDTQLRYILSTHKHADHIGGNLQWAEEKKRKNQELDIIAGKLKPDNIPGYTKTLGDLETLTVGDVCICCMETPGHTEDHVSYIVTHVTPTSTKIPFLFCADTLFIGGCGRLLGGTAEQLFYSLQKLMNLPHETLIFCAHEYTLANLEFAKFIEPNNPMIQPKIELCRKIREMGEFTVGSKIMEERLYNPFIRCASEQYFKDLTGEENDPIRAFAKIRKLKDNYRPGMTL